MRISEGLRIQHLATSIPWRKTVDGLQTPHLRHRHPRQIPRRIAGNDAIELQRHAFGRHHRFAATGGAAHEVGVVGLLAVVTINLRLGFLRGALYRPVTEVELGLLIHTETRIDIVAAAMATVSGYHSKSTRQSRLRARDGTDRCIEHAVESATALHQQATIPVGRQAQLNAGAVTHLFHAGFARLQHYAEQTVRRHWRGGARRAQCKTAGIHPLRGIDTEVGGRHRRQRFAGSAGVGFRCVGANADSQQREGEESRTRVIVHGVDASPTAGRRGRLLVFSRI